MKNNCPLCGRERTYKTKQGFDKGINRPCRSCANSISAGGKGWTPLCIDCNINPRHYHSLCWDCHKARSHKYHKETYRWSKYGLDGPIEMIECEICHSKNDLVIDHCHDTNKVRGILCRTCNFGIGNFKESLSNIESAVNYLRKFYGPITKDFEFDHNL